MKVLGIGLLTARGRGTAAFREALETGWQAPGSFALKSGSIPAYSVDLEKIADKVLLKKLRRSDKLSKMSVLAASDALADAGPAGADRDGLGVIVATAYGAHATTFEFLDGILDFGEAAVSPTVFSNSVHNAAASYISSALGTRGPTLTVTQFFFSFAAALQLAQAWLAEGRVKRVLVGGVDQLGEVLAYIASSRLAVARDGLIRPFGPSGTGAVPGEGAAFFLLGPDTEGGGYCAIDGTGFGEGVPAAKADLTILDADGLTADAPYEQGIAADEPVACFAPLYGSMMIGSAFSCAAAALMLREQVRFASPLAEAVRGLRFVLYGCPASVEFIRCIRYNCRGEYALISLKKR